jgi:carbamoyltransferase
VKVLGVSYSYHDASAALVVDGKVVCSAAEERFSYEKHDPSFPRHAISFCLKHSGISGEELDFVAYNEDPMTKFSRALSSVFQNFPKSSGTFAKSAQDFISHGFWVKHDISKYLNIDPSAVHYIPHHLSHAAHSFLTSGFDSSAVMTIDAVGEWSTACVFNANWKDGLPQLHPVDTTPFPHSLGLLYSAFTAFLGFKVNDGECSTMALAAFGKPTYAEELNKILQINSDGTFAIDLSYFDLSSDEKLPLTEKFISAFGKPRARDFDLDFSAFGDRPLPLTSSSAEQSQRYANIAASVQGAVEKAVVAYGRRAKHLTNSERLCYSGGVALNCVANSRLVEDTDFKEIYIPPDPGDGGGAMGAALYLSALKSKQATIAPMISPFLGHAFDDIASVKEFLTAIDPQEVVKSKIGGLPRRSWDSLDIVETKNDGVLFELTAQALVDRKIVGWFQDRFENGPRALGNRSIVCRPDCITTARRLSINIKVRAEFRPYALSIVEESAGDFLDGSRQSKKFILGKWMQSSFEVKPDRRTDVRAAIHIDGTTRAQVIASEDNPRFHQLISTFGRLSKIPAVLNTSFNLKGLPLVSNPYDAIMMFMKTDLDILVLENLFIRKVFNEAKGV